MTSSELLDLATELQAKGGRQDDKDFFEAIQRMEEAAEEIGESWGGSWLGHHARVYYRDFTPPPAGARFSQEWGFQDAWPIEETLGEWREYTSDDVLSAIRRKAGDPDLAMQEAEAGAAREFFDEAAIAFLVLTGEDEQTDGKLRARMNVIHEAGLFQGRLGFEKAIVLLEEGCEEFSNIQGLGQIRFPQGNIKAIFEEIRTLLERESLLLTSNSKA